MTTLIVLFFRLGTLPTRLTEVVVAPEIHNAQFALKARDRKPGLEIVTCVGLSLMTLSTGGFCFCLLREKPDLSKAITILSSLEKPPKAWFPKVCPGN